ncbi:uncharacterized protein L969DRAFT_14320 [Mixia osmundae IAM 14324]|uniref:Serine-threonine kinase receptor-associated protein n=1 Tax=Mixia osmundae (strain CBS 9802 / IAM 14324 / JCM 22182 / KY 12970) TaxID=764103 RepID=G7DZW1_MIXOS|nr:uncharacterized protein L969DRAFT_14320 [Mixia osmundae IAM 14324]KEI42114.1 hypothetical protein L969DRAFT_14320 [Mixia osmundae IAM 14324]GAA96121.1 hypothetical protein E5Q_02782 [Mixia osmundae IAM 14324]
MASAKPASTPGSTPLVCMGHTRPLTSLAFSPLQPDGSYFLISTCKDKVPLLRAGKSGDWVGSFVGHTGAVWSGKLNRDASRAVTGSADFSAIVWNARTGAAEFTLAHEHIVKAVDISPVGDHVITGGHEGKLRLFNLASASISNGDETARPECTILVAQDVKGKGRAHDGVVRSTIWHDARGEIITAGEDAKIRIWDISSQACIATIEAPSTARTGIPDPISSLQTTGSETILSTTHASNVSLFDLSSRTFVATYKLDYAPSCAAFHPNSPDIFLTGSTQDSAVRIHSRNESADCLHWFKGHHGGVHCIDFSPDGQLYASGSEDGTIRLWQTTQKTYGLWVLEEVTDVPAS